MKKMISLISALALTAACVNASAFAAGGEKPEAADIGGTAYEKLMERQQTYDLNMDGVITMEELTQARTLTLDLDEVTSTEWLGELKDCAYLFLSNGSYTDLSVIGRLTKLHTLSLKNIPAEDLSFLSEIGKIDTLKLDSIPIEDISFLKDMEINTCSITNMPQISVEQRFAVTRYDKDVTVEKGFSSEAGILPRDIFDTNDVKFSVDDPDIVSIGTTTGYISDCRPRIFGKNVGSTEYTLSVDGTDILTGTLTVTEPELFSPPLHDTVSDVKSVSGHMNGAVNMCLTNGTLYTMLNDKAEVYADNVKAFTTSEVRQKYNVYYNYDYILKNDGTLTVNGVEQEGSYAGADFGCFWNDEGELFTVYPRNRKPAVLRITDDFGEFLDDGKNLYVNRDGEVIRYTVDFDEEGGEPTVTTEATGIKDPIDSLQMMIRVKGNDLWKFNPNKPSEMYKKICENVVKLDYCFTDESQGRSYVYFTEDGKAYEIGNYKEVTPSRVTRDEKMGYSENRVVPLYYIDDGSGKPHYPLRLIHTTDGTMTFAFKDNHMSVTDVEQYLCLRMDNGIENGFVYFSRTDGSIWQYDIAANVCREMVSTEQTAEVVSGDLNGDGEVLVSDLILMNKWLLGSGGSATLKTADLNGDRTVDVFDLCSLRKLLLSQMPAFPQSDTPVYNLCKDISKTTSDTKNADEAFIMGQTQFAAELFRKTAAENSNTFISPYSLMQALAMTANGADGDTRTEMEKALGGVDIDELNRYLAGFSRDIRGNTSIIRNVNSIWAINDLSRMAPRQTFLKKAANYYGADFFTAPFNDDTVSEINKYVSDGTDGQIPEVIKNISPDDTMYLINTVVFNADWLNRYYGNHTGSAVFTNVHGVEQPCTLMTSTEKYIGDDTTDGFIKYYSNTDIAFAALLPHEDININDYIGSLTAEKLNGLLTQESEDIAYCGMLKFGFRYSNDLSDELRAMGIEKAFTPDADFSRLSSADNPTFIRQVTHDTFVNVNEKGTFAGAASVVKIMDGGGLPPKMVILNRPFVYCIFDTNTGIPLFIGTVMDMDGLEASED